MTITDPDETRVPGVEVLRKLFHLGESELRLTLALAVRSNLNAATQQAGLFYETSRNYLKSVFAKTGTNSQGELLALLTRIARG